MKTYLLRLLLLMIPLLGLGMPLQAQFEWQRTYGGPFDDACEVRALEDGGFIFISSYQTFDSWLVRVDAYGDTMWTRRLDWANFCSVVPTYDGGFFLGGTTFAQTRQEVGYKVDALGDSVWAYIYADPNDHGMYRVEENNAHGLLITGYVNYPNNTYDMWVRQIDEAGTSVWAYGFGTPGNEFGAMPAKCADGGYLFVTTRDTLSSTRFYMVRTNFSGIVQWQRSYSPGRPVGGPVVEPLPDGGFLIIGWIELPGNNYNTFLLRTDSLGNALWTRDHGGLGFEDRTANGIIRDLRGGYTFAAIEDQTFGPGFERDMAIYHLDTNGMLQGIRRVGFPSDDVPRYICQSPDSGYAVIGYSQSFAPGSYQVYLAKIAGNGCDEGFYWPGFPERDTACQSTPLILDAGPGYAGYLWSTGDTSRYLQVQGSDTVHVMVTDGQGCRKYSNWCRVAATEPLQYTWADTGLSVQFDGSQAGDWDFGDGNSTSGNDPMHTYASSGTYVVCLNINDNFCGLLSFCDTVIVESPLHVSLGAGTGLSIHPNPGTGLATVNTAGRECMEISVFNNLGKRVWQGRRLGPNPEVDLSDLAQGAYWLLCRDMNGNTEGGWWLKQ